jgi:hypothetical protein
MTTATRRTTLRSASTLVCLGAGSLALLSLTLLNTSCGKGQAQYLPPDTTPTYPKPQ